MWRQSRNCSSAERYKPAQPELDTQYHRQSASQSREESTHDSPNEFCTRPYPPCPINEAGQKRCNGFEMRGFPGRDSERIRKITGSRERNRDVPGLYMRFQNLDVFTRRQGQSANANCRTNYHYEEEKTPHRRAVHPRGKPDCYRVPWAVSLAFIRDSHFDFPVDR